jgi:HEAT repeat protein
MNRSLTLLILLATLALPSTLEAARKPKISPTEKTAQDLQAALTKGDEQTVDKLVLALENRPQEVVPVARLLLAAGDEKSKAAALQLLGHQLTSESAVLLGTLLDNPEFEKRIEVIEKLGAMKGIPEANQILEKLAKGNLPYEREKAVEALGKLADPSAVATISAACFDGLFSVRMSACKALASFDDKTARGTLGKVLLEDTNVGVRTEAAKALGATKSRASVPHLVPGLKDQSFAVQTAVAEALRDATGMDLGPDYPAWESWEKKNR